MDILNKIRELQGSRGWTDYKLAQEADIPLATLRKRYLQNKTVYNQTAIMPFRILETARRRNVLFCFAGMLLPIRIQALRRKARRKYVVT